MKPSQEAYDRQERWVGLAEAARELGIHITTLRRWADAGAVERAFGDLNNDGSLDIVVTSLNEPPRILMNSGGGGNHWLMMELTGRKSARRAVVVSPQARSPVALFTMSRVQTRW